MNNNALTINEEVLVLGVATKYASNRIHTEEEIEQEAEYSLLDMTEWKALELDQKEYYSIIFRVASKVLELVK